MRASLDHALAICQPAVDAVKPNPLVRQALSDPDVGIASALADAKRILVLGAGKAGAAMANAVEDALGEHLDKLEGVVNVPAEAVTPLRRIRLHAARPAGSNQPTTSGVEG